MPPKLLSTRLIKHFEKGGRKIVISFAEQVENYKRVEVSDKSKEEFVEALQHADIHPDVAHIILMGPLHISPGDDTLHWNARCQDKKGNHLVTRHFYPPAGSSTTGPSENKLSAEQSFKDQPSKEEAAKGGPETTS
ncbi:hypothetical protein DM02DRAFT_698055 [Periconia macrospinosa]|uniref:Uncharacterized protein n=1 Tax=Periconia macrospinosa TaxID=97972 RepID=A0A2V1D4D6_9PLEO|nr:hypothetical protein DM02DRAFT_698055 [Periconia macrospinosa]